MAIRDLLVVLSASSAPGKIPGADQAAIRWAKIRDPNGEEQKKFKMSGLSYCRNGSGIYFDTAEIFSVVWMVLTSGLSRF
jgi:hypothetical protein